MQEHLWAESLQQTSQPWQRRRKSASFNVNQYTRKWEYSYIITVGLLPECQCLQVAEH